MGFGRMLIAVGLALAVVGLLFTFADRLPFKPGRLPGDIYYHGKNTVIYVPLVTCILLSAVFSLVLWILRR